MERVSIVGSAGAGKTTLAGELARRLGLEHVELDALYHLPGWRRPDPEDFRARVAAALDGGRWVVCGTYAEARELVWDRTDTIVWLDLPRSTVTRRIVARTWRRVRTGEELWNGNRERWWNLLAPHPRYNVVLYSVLSHDLHRRRYARALAREERPGQEVVRLRSASEVELWLGRVASPGRGDAGPLDAAPGQPPR